MLESQVGEEVTGSADSKRARVFGLKQGKHTC